MKNSVSGIFRSLTVKVIMGLVLATMISGMDVAPASAGDDHRGRHYDNRGNDHRGRGHDRGYYRGHYRGRPVYRSYGYVEPVYVAPPVYYAPAPAPGVSIFLPTIHIR
jgi:hypothetical protein